MKAVKYSKDVDALVIELSDEAIAYAEKVYRLGCREIAIARCADLSVRTGIKPISARLIRLGIVVRLPSSRTNS
ncbi:hypothetical protein [Coleofasciculus sp. H7-2]|uniref:hypothetical protein n=1 Tax=Coleofasciculus sp. H7-2 TaxID=3351545 RepID=UPI00367277C0